mgnify:CR=1 FL=1
MENKKKHSYGLVKVYSQELLRTLNDNKCMGELKDVVFDKEKNQFVYLFAETEEVAEIIMSFEKEFGKDEELSNQVYYVSNYEALNQIIDMGYGNMLIDTFWNQKRNKRVFVFRYDIRIEEINDKIKEHARNEYSRKHYKYDDENGFDDLESEDW